MQRMVTLFLLCDRVDNTKFASSRSSGCWPFAKADWHIDKQVQELVLKLDLLEAHLRIPVKLIANKSPNR